MKKIAVLRANAVGDFIVTLPALEALRNAYPDAEIVLLGRHWHAGFLSGRLGPVDRTIVVPYSSGIYDPPASEKCDQKANEAFFQSMAREGFDLAFQLHGGGKNSNPFVLGLGAKYAVGARTPDAAPLDRWIPYRLFQNEMLRLLEIVSLAGVKPVHFEPGLHITPGDITEAEREVPEDGRPIVIVSPGCRDPRRRWPAKKFAAVADGLAERGARIIINGDPGDRTVAEETLSEMRREAQNVCGSLSLNGLVGLLSRAKLLVSNDSGPFHLATALNTRSVAIFWCGNVLTYGPVRWRRTVLHISWRTDCPRCGARCMYTGCGHKDSFVDEISADEVTASALEFFQEREEIDA